MFDGGIMPGRAKPARPSLVAVGKMSAPRIGTDVVAHNAVSTLAQVLDRIPADFCADVLEHGAASSGSPATPGSPPPSPRDRSSDVLTGAKQSPLTHSGEGGRRWGPRRRLIGGRQLSLH